MKRIKIAIIILAAAILAAIGIFLIANNINDKAVKKAESEEEKLIMFEFNNDDAKKVEIDNDGGSFIVEYISGSGWTLTNTDQFLINDAIPSAICANLADLKATKILESTDKSKYGLDDPVKVTVYTDKEAYTVLVGDPTPTYENFYAMKENDDNIYLIDFSSGSILSPSKDDLKYIYLYPYSSYDVTSFSLWKGNETDQNILFSMNKDSGGTWTMDKPYKDNSVYYTQINTFLTRSTKDQINSFVQENCTEADYSKYGFDNPQYVFEISTEDETTKVIFGNYTNNDTEIYGLFTQSGQVVTFLSNAVTTLGYKTSDMMNTRIFSTDISNVDTVDVTMPDAKVTLEINGKSDGYSINQKSVSGNAKEQFISFFDAFNSTYASASESDGTPSGDAEVIVKYSLTNNIVTDLSYIPVPNSDKYWVIKDGDYTGYVVDKAAVSKIISSYKELAKTMNIS